MVFIRKLKLNQVNYDVINWEINNYHAHIAQYLKSKPNQRMIFAQLIEYNVRNIFPEKFCRK